MKYQGHARLDLLRDGKVVHREEHKNDVTAFVQNAIGKGNFHNLISSNNIMSIFGNWFGGCLLTDNTNDATTMLLDGGSTVVAQASNDSYSGTNLRRGNVNTADSQVITGGYKFVWEWDTTRGNGTINSVCLTRPQIARMDFSTTAVTEDVGVAIDNLTNGYFAAVDTTICNCNVIDYETEKGYQVTYSSGKITIKEFNFSCKALHLLTPLYGAVQNGSDHTISRTVANYAIASASVSYDDTNKVLHLLTWSGNKLNDYAINTANLDACTATTHTIADVTFFNTVATVNTTILRRDVILIDNGYAWAMVNSGQKIVKIDLTNNVVSSEYNNPIYTVGGSASTDNNGSFMKLTNGDIYKFGNVRNVDSPAGGIEPCVYYHNGIMFYAKNYNISRYQSEVGFHSNNYGTFVRTAGSSTSVNTFYRAGVATCFPYVSTICNLNNSVTKNAGLTMRLDYSVTES